MPKHYLPFSRNLIERVRTLSRDNPQYRRQETVFGIDIELAEFYFVLDPKTAILASRSGTVLDVLKNKHILKKTSSSEKSLHETNLISIVHDDDTVAMYVHVFPRVRKGQSVDTGDNLGELGGWAKKYDPHLHLDFFEDSELLTRAPVFLSVESIKVDLSFLYLLFP